MLDLGPAQVAAFLVAGQRLAELQLARAHDRALRARGGEESGEVNHLALVALHTAWLVAIAALPASRAADGLLLALYALLQPLRYWCIASLGDRWTTRVIAVPGERLVRRGPYRWVAHPNYWVVAAEIAVLPAAFGAFRLALAFSALNALALVWRIQIERRALAPRAP